MSIGPEMSVCPFCWDQREKFGDHTCKSTREKSMGHYESDNFSKDKESEVGNQDLPYIKGSKAAGYDWVKIEDEASRDRTYVYKNGERFVVKGVVWICVKKSDKGDSHRLYTVDRTSIYVRAGWEAIEWNGKFQF